MRRLLVLMVAVALLMLPAGSAGATPPSDVHIEVEENLLTNGDFVATGPAVDAGIMCPAGTTEDLIGKTSGNGPWGFNVQVLKEFTCADGSGTFLLKLQVRVVFNQPISSIYNWNVKGGTGAYADLHGSGVGIGLPPLDGYDILDTYDGGVHTH